MIFNHIASFHLTYQHFLFTCTEVPSPDPKIILLVIHWFKYLTAAPVDAVKRKIEEMSLCSVLMWKYRSSRYEIL